MLLLSVVLFTPDTFANCTGPGTSCTLPSGEEGVCTYEPNSNQNFCLPRDFDPSQPGGRNSDEGQDSEGRDSDPGAEEGGRDSDPGQDSGDSSGSSGSPNPQSISFQNPISANSIPELISRLINAALGILGAITVVILVISGFKYMTSTNPGEVAQATQGITNAIVGLIIIMGSFLITDYIISALL